MYSYFVAAALVCDGMPWRCEISTSMRHRRHAMSPVVQKMDSAIIVIH